MELLDLLDGHNEEAADDGQGDGGREGEVVARDTTMVDMMTGPHI